MWLLFDTVACFGCPYQPSSGRAPFQKKGTKGGEFSLSNSGCKL